MTLYIHTITPANEVSLTSQQLSVSELAEYALSIITNIRRYRPEYVEIALLQRNSGCRITELFEPCRWTFPRSANVQILPQKGNSTRVIALAELGYPNAEAMQPVLADMGRLPKGQYERAFSQAVKDVGLWRLYDNGFTHPSTHFFRHLKIKELKNENFDLAYISNWIGEKSMQNLNYYFESQFFGEVER